jgi:dUTP pyrophosphatase
MNYSLDPGAYPITRAHPQDAGADLRTPIDFVLWPKCRRLINTGVHVEIPYGKAGFLKSKSGLSAKFANQSEGVIDAGFTGVIGVVMYNHGWLPKRYKAGDKITQLVVMDVVMDDWKQVDAVTGFERGNGGFGSTGK